LPGRRIIVGAIGGDRQKEGALALGKAVAEAGCILLTGGKLLTGQDPGANEVKHAAMIGAVSAKGAGSIARLVGIIPDNRTEIVPGERNWDESVEKSLFLLTGLPSNLRNLINGVTPDVLVAFGGGRGTLAELAFALAARKKIILWDCASHQRLLSNFRKYFSDPVDQLRRPRLHGQRRAKDSRARR
jgi:predicted Rossmann-fold nucleotide-binding protein